MPVRGSTLGSLQRVVRHEMSKVSEPKRAWKELVGMDGQVHIVLRMGVYCFPAVFVKGGWAGEDDIRTVAEGI